MKKLIVAVFLLIEAGAFAQTGLETYVSALAGKEPFASSVWGVKAVTLSGETLVEYNARPKMLPASNMKLITTGIALKELGADFRFKTALAYDGKLEDGVLEGNLFIVGGGDPTTGKKTLPGWGDIVKAAGIRKINGRVIGDSRYLTGVAENEDWTAGDYECEDASPVKGLNFEHNYKDTLYAPEKVSGAEYCAYYFRNLLIDNGIAISGGHCDDAEYEGTLPPQDSLHILGCSYSEPLASIIRTTNEKSDNFYAEALCRTIGKEKGAGDGYPESIAAEMSVLKEMGLDTVNGIRICDGSGLARKNYLSPDFMVNYLCAMSETDVFPEFLASLPEPGEFTLAGMMQKASPQTRARIHMKSGTLGDVRCFSGYIDPESCDDSAQMKVFCLLTNNNTAPRGTVLKYIEQIILLIAE